MVLPNKKSYAQIYPMPIKKKTITNMTVPAVDFKQLNRICKMQVKDFHTNFKKVRTPDGSYFFQDNGADVLLVAHLDTVLPYRWQGILNTGTDTEIYCTVLDDRLGAYVILDMLKRTNIQYDILLTENEEKGNSTASYFEAPTGKQYNWIASFDRPGEGFVMYQYGDNLDAKRAAESVGFANNGYGSYNCIADLEFLNVCGFNFGVGYHGQHYPKSYASLNEVRSQVRKFLHFYQKFANIKFDHTPRYNTLSKHYGLTYDGKEAEIYNQAEREYAFSLYEQLQTGVSPEVLGFSATGRLSIHQIRKMMKAPELKIGPSEDVGTYQEVFKFSKASALPRPLTKEQSKTEAIIYTHPFGNSASRLKESIEKLGEEAEVIGSCLNCGSDYILPNEATGDIVAFCPECLETMRNKDTEKDIAEAKKEDKEPIIQSLPLPKELTLKVLLEQYRNKPTPKGLGTILRVIREAVPDRKVRDIMINLNAAKIHYPEVKITPNQPLKLTQKLLAIAAKADNFDLGAESEGNEKGHKIISKLENGHAGFFTKCNFREKNKKKQNYEILDFYIIALAQYVPEESVEILEELMSIPTPYYEEGEATVTPMPTVKKELPAASIGKKLIKAWPLIELAGEGSYKLTHITSENGSKVSKYQWTVRHPVSQKQEVT